MIAGLQDVHVVSLDPSMLTIHWRIAEPGGRQVVLEIIDGKYNIHENKIGVITNAPSFTWHLTNLNNYVNLYPGVAKSQKWNGVELSSISAGSAFHGIPGDVTSTSRFVRAAFFVATAPQGIILEDDCLPGEDFFRYAAAALDFYRDDPQVMHINGSSFFPLREETPYSAFFYRYAHIWGWASWRRAWKYYDGLSLPGHS